MCGIIAYSGHQPASPLLLEGLKRLEYRGYDSSGMAFIQQGKVHCLKAPGKLAALEEKLAHSEMPLLATCGLAHTRWATHGIPNEQNAHPHISNDNKFILVHNGIIENFRELKNDLISKGYTFYSETDSEVFVNLIAEKRKHTQDNISAFSEAIKEANGAYAIVLMCLDEPETLYATRKSAPLIAGIGTGENFAASDVTAFLSYTKRVVFLNEGEIIRLSPNNYQLFAVQDLAPLEVKIDTIEWDVQTAQKEGFKHFMLKEIFEQPHVLTSVLMGRADIPGGKVSLPELSELQRPSRVRIVACGTSYNAGSWAAPLIEQWGGIPCTVEIASEFRYRKPILGADELVILISQSGETADTLAAMYVAHDCGCATLGLCNVVGSSLAREAKHVLYTQAGPEISVASTKALFSQMALLTLLSLYWGVQSGKQETAQVSQLLQKFASVSTVLERELHAMHEAVKPIAVRAAAAHNIFFLGRGQSYAMAMEGALKLKELSYVHAEAYAAGEMKHGPIALVDPDFLTVALAPRDEHFAKTVSNIEEISARSGPVITLTEAANNGEAIKTDMLWIMPHIEAPFCSFIMLPMLQLLSYEAASHLGKDVDQPRNLAKSVTVE